MRRRAALAAVALAAALAAGCAAKKGPDAGNLGSPDGGVAPPDMTDVSPLPAPIATHVGVAGPTCCIVTDAANAHVAYLSHPTVLQKTVGQQVVQFGIAGELHLATIGGGDATIAPNVFLGSYALSPDGKGVFYVTFDATVGTSPAAGLSFFPVGGQAPKSVIATGMPVRTVAILGTQAMPVPYFAPAPLPFFFAPSGRFILTGVMAPQTSGNVLDLHVFDTSSGADVLQRPNGGANYNQLVLPDDTLVFQDTAGGTGAAAPPTTPVQTLYWVTLGGSGSATPITTHTASFAPTADNRTIVILKTNGDLWTFDVAEKRLGAAPLATGAVNFALGNAATGPVAWLGADHSVHVVATDGTGRRDVAAASAAADLTGPLAISPDGADLYYMQHVESQNNRGTLMHVGADGAPAKVGDHVSTHDLFIAGADLVYLQNVDDQGQMGDAVRAARDGSGRLPLGGGVDVGGLHVATPAPDTWFTLFLGSAVLHASDNPIDGSAPILGALYFAGSAGDPPTALDPTVHAGAFAFADDGRTVAFLSGAAFDPRAGNYTGALQLAATRAPDGAVAANLSGVTELGPIVARSLFVNAPLAAADPGVYLIKY